MCVLIATLFLPRLLASAVLMAIAIQRGPLTGKKIPQQNHPKRGDRRSFRTGPAAGPALLNQAEKKVSNLAAG